MNYADIRSEIKSGDILAWGHDDWNNIYDLQIQAVRVFTQSEYSHVGLAWVVGGRVFVIESVVPKIRIVPLSNMLEDGVYWLPQKVSMSEAELEFALSKVGVGVYSKWQAMMAQLRRLTIGADNLWQCAEFVIECRKLSGVSLGDKATPAEVVKAAQENGSPTYFITDRK